MREFLADGEDGSVQIPNTQFVGTPGFAPPEQLALRSCYSSDIYALGMTCLYLLTGRTPVEFETDIHTHEVRWEQTVCLSAHFTKVLTQMLKPSLEDRFPTVEALGRMLALEPYLDSLKACMNIHPRGDCNEPSTQDIPPKNRYLTPIQREAAAIRGWRKRRLGATTKSPTRRNVRASP